MEPKKDHSTSDHLGASGKFHYCFKTEKAQAIGKLALTAIHFKIIQTLTDTKSITIYWASTLYQTVKKKKVQRKKL